MKTGGHVKGTVHPELKVVTSRQGRWTHNAETVTGEWGLGSSID